MHFIKLIKQYKELAPMARDAGKSLARRVVLRGRMARKI